MDSSISPAGGNPGPGTRAPAPDVSSFWAAYAEPLADWAFSRVVVRRDVYGGYTPDGGQLTLHEPLTRELLVRHFRGEVIVGAHTTSADNRCLTVSVDIDAHDEKADPDANWRCALAVAEMFRSLGLTALICDSNGKGGYHVRAFFKKPVPTAVAYWFGERIKAGLEADGFATVEVFPKQGELTLDRPYGNWIRIPGRHHRRDHWTRIYDPRSGRWLEGEDAVLRLIAVAGDKTTKLLEAHKAEREAKVNPVSKKSGATRRHDREEKPDEAKVRGALDFLSDSWAETYGGSRAETGWLGVGMALHDWDPSRGLPLWHEFSARSTKYDHAICDAKWETFTQGGGLTVATIFKEAMNRGWQPPSSNTKDATSNGTSAGPKPSGNGEAHAATVPTADQVVIRERLEIVITTEAHEVIDQGVAALATDPEVYQRGHALVRVVREPARAAKIGRPVGTPRIAIIPGPTILEKLSRSAEWTKPKTTRNGDVVLAPALPPDWCVAGVAARAEWQGIRPLEAVVEAPTVRPDGSILDTPGYDEETGLLLVPNATFPEIPTGPTHDDARRAAAELLALVEDFPFAEMTDAKGVSDHGATHRSAWLASVLTVLARFAIDGPTPLTVFDATTPGSGKTLLAELVSRISTGRSMPRTAYPDDDEEMRKRITSIALEGDRLVLIDNIATTFGGSALDAALTGTTWRDRILGRNEMTAELPLHAVWFGSGNNVQFRGDVLRRIVHCRLEPKQERPEERDPNKFAIREPLPSYVAKHRPRLVAAGLTIIRAFVVANRPDQKLTAVDYREWSDLIRSAVYWTIGADPCASRKDLSATDGETADRAALVDGWAELPMSDRGVTTAEALRILRDNPGHYSGLRSTIITRSGELPSTKSLGKMLAKIRGRVIGIRAIHSVDAGKNTLAWKVVESPAKVVESPDGGFGGFSGFTPATPRENCTDNCSTKMGETSGDQTHQTHQTHREGSDPPRDVRVWQSDDNQIDWTQV
jgi:hypothetical protein